MSGFLDLVAKGGGPTAALVLVGLVWAPSLGILIVMQRIRLGRRLRDLVPGGDPAAAVAAVRQNLGPLESGRIGVAVVAVWWLVALLALLAAARLPMPLGDMVGDGLAAGAPGLSARELARLTSAVLITRSIIGVLGLPALGISLLALDQILFRPRTRYLDEVRLRVGGDREAPAVARRAAARMSWTATYFGWIWLAFKGLPGRAVLVFVAHAGAAALLGVLLGLGILPPTQRPPYSLDFEPTVWAWFWRPAISNAVAIGLGSAIALYVGLRGEGWAVQQRLGRMSESRGSVEP